jgi:serine O-acetyltransferase
MTRRLAPVLTIFGDFDIGNFARIGAGSIVTGDVPRGCTAIGVPARPTNCPQQPLLA